MKYEVDCNDGHMFVSVAEGVFLVDTGSPTSFSRSGSLSFAGLLETMPTNAMGMMDADDLSGYVGMAIDGLIGIDVLSRHLLVFDGNSLFVDESPIPDAEFVPLDNDSFMGIPVVPIRVAGRNVKMFLDTGAKISYLDNALLGNARVDATLSEFYPGLGQFSVDVSIVSGEIAGFPMTARFGRLPSLLQTTLTMGGVNGILGHDLFARFQVRLERGVSSVAIAQRQVNASGASAAFNSCRDQSNEANDPPKGPSIHLDTDDIFDSLRRNAFQGVALFVPLGLTAFRVEVSDFVKKNGVPLSENGVIKVFGVESEKIASLVRIIEVQPPRFKPFCKKDVDAIIKKTLDVFEEAGCTTIGMNGIKIDEDDRSRNRFLSEQTTLDAVRNWGRQHSHSTIRDIYLVDKRGGFEHVE